MTTQSPATRDITQEADFLKITSFDHVHFWVGNAKQAMFY